MTKYTNLQEACTFFVGIGFDIQTINSYAQPITEQEYTKIIAQAQQEVAQKKSLIEEQIKKNEEKTKKVYEDADLESAKKIIIRIFEKIDETIKRSE
ncbi:MAG: hypothetical protein WCH65_02880 [bacterium]